MNPDYSKWMFATTGDPTPDHPFDRRFLVPAQADGNRKTRRALVKAAGARQFKKLYRKTPT